MNIRQIVVLAIILAVLAGGIVWKQYRKPPEFVSEEYAALDFSFDPEQAAKIELAKGEGGPAVTLVKQDGGWRVSNLLNARADKIKIEQLLKTVREAKGELRGKEPSLFQDFGITDAGAYRLAILDAGDKPLLILLIGTKKPAYESIFLRRKGSDSVYLSNADLFGQMGLWGDPAAESLNADYWVVAEDKAEKPADPNA